MFRMAFAALGALSLMATAAEAAPGRAVDGLIGCWRASGVIRGKPLTQHARGRWTLDGKYFLLQLANAPGQAKYAAAVFFGRTEDGHVVAHWLDTTGVESEFLGKGFETAERIETAFEYPDGPATNVITLEPGGWRMHIIETPKGKPTRDFSDHHYRPIACATAGEFPL